MRKPITFGNYCLLERINVGGMAEVFRAKAFGVAGFERLVAVKRILPNIAEDRDFIRMFIDEAKIAVQLNHANIAQVFDLGRVEGAYYIALEHVFGRDLRAVYDKCNDGGSPMPVDMACFAVMKMCQGLDYAHKRKGADGKPLELVHRDVSPQNVLVSFDGEVKVIDFGIAKAAGNATKTQAGILKGKFAYMSPEQVRGLPVDRRSDIFSAAIVLYELLTGERLFSGESDFSTLEKVRFADVQPIHEVNPSVPKELSAILRKGLAKDPEDRYQYAIEFHDALERFVRKSKKFCSPQDMAQWMRGHFQEEIESEKKKIEAFRSIKPPGGQKGALGLATSIDLGFAEEPRGRNAPTADLHRRQKSSNTVTSSLVTGYSAFETGYSSMYDGENTEHTDGMASRYDYYTEHERSVVTSDTRQENGESRYQYDEGTFGVDNPYDTVPGETNYTRAPGKTGFASVHTIQKKQQKETRESATAPVIVDFQSSGLPDILEALSGEESEAYDSQLPTPGPSPSKNEANHSIAALIPSLSGGAGETENGGGVNNSPTVDFGAKLPRKESDVFSAVSFVGGPETICTTAPDGSESASLRQESAVNLSNTQKRQVYSALAAVPTADSGVDNAADVHASGAFAAAGQQGRSLSPLPDFDPRNAGSEAEFPFKMDGAMDSSSFPHVASNGRPRTSPPSVLPNPDRPSTLMAADGNFSRSQRMESPVVIGFNQPAPRRSGGVLLFLLTLLLFGGGIGTYYVFQSRGLTWQAAVTFLRSMRSEVTSPAASKSVVPNRVSAKPAPIVRPANQKRPGVTKAAAKVTIKRPAQPVRSDTEADLLNKPVVQKEIKSNEAVLPAETIAIRPEALSPVDVAVVREVAGSADQTDKVERSVTSKRDKASSRRKESRKRDRDSEAYQARGEGVLLLGSKPPCRIFIDGRDIGKSTPQRDIRLIAGTHRVTLVHRDYGIRESFNVKIKNKQTTRAVRDLLK